MKKTSYWTDHFPRPTDLQSSSLPTHVDVAIVGGGYTGLNAARVLAKSGASVAVLEQNTIGWGASSRNGGLVTTGLKKPIQAIFKRYGEELGRAFWRASLDAVDLIGEIIADEGLECDFRRNGHVALASKPAHFRSMQKKARWLREKLGHKVHVVPPGELAAEIGTSAYFGGVVDELSASIDPAKYVFGLAQAAARHGAQLCENTSVTALRLQPQGFTIQTSRGVTSAKEMVVATNGYTEGLVPKLKTRIFPIGSYVVVTEPLPPELQQALSPKGRVFYDSKWLLNYFRLTPDGRLLFGGRNDLRSDRDLEDSADFLRRQMIGVFPQLRDVPLTHSWTGQLGVTFDLMPHIGRVNGVYYAFGYGGHGVSIATYQGTEMGMLLTGEKTSSPFAQIPHQSMFFYRNQPWFIPVATVFYRLLDYLT